MFNEPEEDDDHFEDDDDHFEHEETGLECMLVKKQEGKLKQTLPTTFFNQNSVILHVE